MNRNHQTRLTSVAAGAALCASQPSARAWTTAISFNGIRMPMECAVKELGDWKFNYDGQPWRTVQLFVPGFAGGGHIVADAAVVFTDEECSTPIDVGAAPPARQVGARYGTNLATRNTGEPFWPKFFLLASCTSIDQAMDAYYRPERLNRPGGTRERLIADRQDDFDSQGWCVLASYHDSTVGVTAYAKGVGSAVLVYRDYIPERERWFNSIGTSQASS
ncbi:hypothetical protein [Paraburkholderia sp. SIMBA_054]|uniref:hypothetical protein n=1 Tax=Paraburkholderia sp. SIMBA_054 TaxID=3085795 RepID=UPI00397B2D34